MAKAKMPVSINGIEFDALLNEDRSYEATVPEYPVESGFVVSDTIILKPEILNMTLFVTDTPVTWYRRHGARPGRSEEIARQLEKMYYERIPVLVTTSDKAYSDMCIESIKITKSADIGYAREIPISFKKLRTVSSRTTTIPDSYGKSGKTGASAGSVSITTASSGATGSSGSSPGAKAGSDGEASSRASILYGAASSLGLLK